MRNYLIEGLFSFLKKIVLMSIMPGGIPYKNGRSEKKVTLSDSQLRYVNENDNTNQLDKG